MAISSLNRDELRAVIIATFGRECTCDDGDRYGGAIHREGCPFERSAALESTANWSAIKQKLRAALASMTSAQACGCDPKAAWACAEHQAQGVMNWGDLLEPLEGDR